MNKKELVVFYLITLVIGLVFGVTLYALFTVNIFISLLVGFLVSLFIYVLIGFPVHIILYKRRVKNV